MRIYPMDGVPNFRDFGDYPTTDGRRVVGKRLFRAGHQGTPTASDIEQLDALDISLIIDLRRSFEREKQPRIWPEDGTAEIIVDTDGGSRPSAPPFAAFLSQPDVTADRTVAYIRDSYREIAYDPRHIRLYSMFFNRLLTNERASLVSCTHGKDRTGILCGLILSVLGVSEDIVLEDYDLTNSTIDLDAGLPAAQASFARTYDLNPPTDVLATFLSVKPDYLAAAFDEMRARNGSVEGYLEMLGFTERDRSALREIYLR